ncbi:MAG: farnesyl-diphosphate farnesyltransferase [Phycisphaeraceae bacterium]|nr:farnesyl-diphosphate farnesyltransferase [Phycisphaeraceae bacterium]
MIGSDGDRAPGSVVDGTASSGVAVGGRPVTIDVSMAHCRDVTRRRARNFYYGLKLTPEPKRSALYAIYAFMRACDDLADEVDIEVPGAANEAIERIERFRARMVEAVDRGPEATLPGGPVWPAFQQVVHRYDVDPAHLHAMLDGQCDDMVRRRYADFEQLRDYCYKVASVVGLMCIDVWGWQDEKDAAVGREKAADRGIALQLTNILRDVVEDARRDRVYLPADELARFDLDADELRRQLLSGDVDGRFDDLMGFQLERARSYFHRSNGLERLIQSDCRPTCWSMMRIYRGILDRIEKRPRAVLTRRVRLSGVEKSMIAMSAMFRIFSDS